MLWSLHALILLNFAEAHFEESFTVNDLYVEISHTPMLFRIVAFPPFKGLRARAFGA